MIKWLEALPDRVSFWKRLEQACPVEAAMLWAEAPLLGYGDAGLWLQETESGPAALLLRNPMGGVVLAALPQADSSELAEFLRMAGFASLTLPAEWTERISLPDVCTEEYTVMEWQEQKNMLPSGYQLLPIAAEELLQNTLSAFGQTIPQEEQAEWKWAFALRVRRERAAAAGLFQQGQRLSAAALSHIGRSAAVIGFVGTPPALRGSGYGRLLAKELAVQTKQQGKRPLLCCRDELEKMYRTAGFAAIGRQSVVRPL